MRTRRTFRCCLCLWLRPSSEILLDGAVTLKMVTQLCFVLDFFVTFSYVLIFVIIDSSVWLPLSGIFALQMLATLILLCDTTFFDLGQSWVYRCKVFLTTVGLLAITAFYLLQTHLISGKMRGTYFSGHFLILKTIYDAFQTYFIWSRHVHDSGQSSMESQKPVSFNKVKPL